MTREKVKFHVERDSFGAEACMILMAMSAIFRLIGCWGLWKDSSYAVTQIALPVLSALLMIGAVWFFGRRALWMSFIPVTLGAVFFMIKAFGFVSRLHMVLCLLLYIAVIALYFCTVFGIFRTKWILVALFGLPFLYHIFVEDLPALQNTANPVTFAAGMQEMGVLCIMLGLFCLSLSMKKEVKVIEEPLPAIKKPKVTRPGHAEVAAGAPQETAEGTEPAQTAQQAPAEEASESAPTEDWTEGEDEAEI